MSCDFVRDMADPHAFGSRQARLLHHDGTDGSCEAHAVCHDEGLTGACCPTDTGNVLPCCDGLSEETSDQFMILVVAFGAGAALLALVWICHLYHHRDEDDEDEYVGNRGRRKHGADAHKRRKSLSLPETREEYARRTGAISGGQNGNNRPVAVLRNT